MSEQRNTMQEKNMQQVSTTQKIVKTLVKIFTYLFLIVMAIIVLFPFYWMIISSLKTLDEYRPTKTDREDYLSPKFRISSAYGQLGDNLLTYAQAKKRCAAYQEDGYPAGRWRLATAAELQYIAMLCANGGLPKSLFGNESYGYWSATVPYILNSSDGTVKATNGSSAWLRCVYDDWYWGQDQLTDRTKYMWGDESTTAELNATLK